MGGTGVGEGHGVMLGRRVHGGDGLGRKRGRMGRGSRVMIFVVWENECNDGGKGMERWVGSVGGLVVEDEHAVLR